MYSSSASSRRSHNTATGTVTSPPPFDNSAENGNCCEPISGSVCQKSRTNGAPSTNCTASVSEYVRNPDGMKSAPTAVPFSV